MHIDILTVLPDLLQSPLSHSIMKRAQDKGLLTVEVHNLRACIVPDTGSMVAIPNAFPTVSVPFKPATIPNAWEGQSLKVKPKE